LGAAKRYPVLGSCLAPESEGRTAKADGPDLMSDAAQAYAAERQQQLKALGGLAEEDRLYRNLLSSQPLAFSIAGELRAHPAAAARVLAALTESPVVGLDHLEDAGTPSHAVHGIEAEWFPPRDLHTADHSGFDIAAYLKLRDGQRLLVSIEVKYTDSFSPKKMTWERYGAHLQAAGLHESAMQDIVQAGGSQFLRSVLLTNSLRRCGVRRPPGVGQVLAVVLARGDDR
jgi:hypothetical protein